MFFELDFSGEQKVEDDIDKQRGYMVAERNELVQNQVYRVNKGKGRSLSLRQQKFLLFLISRIKPTDTEFEPQSFSLYEFCDVCGIKLQNAGGAAFKKLKEAIEGIQGQVMWLDDGVEETTLQWLYKVTINKVTKMVYVEFRPDMAPFLLGLKEKYFSFPLYMIIKMRSKFGIQLFQLLRSYCYKKDVQRIRFDTDDLKDRLDCSSYNVTIFKQKVLEPAICDINSYTDLDVEYSLIKEPGSSKESCIEFTVRHLDPEAKC